LLIPVSVLLSGTLPTSGAIAGLLLVAGTVLLGIPVSAIERKRLALLSSASEPPILNPHRRVPDRGLAAWLRIRTGETVTWLEVAYTAVFTLAFTVVNIAVLALSVLCLSFVVLPIVVIGVTPDTVMLGDLGRITEPVQSLPFAAAGLAGAVLCLYIIGALASGQASFARTMLLPRESEDDRVVELTRSRARLVNIFEDERRRIERDLHDGAQQRLLALSLTLGLAKLELPDTTSRAGALVAKAHTEAKQAISELRELIRGIHPRMLTDRGLVPAVEDLAERCQVAVSVRIVLPHRLPEAVEGAAYYILSEALTNVVKHSQATQADITGSLAGEHLLITVSDNGVGGADSMAGTGLRGLADRVAVLEGRLTLASPPGGPTVLSAEIPCPPQQSPDGHQR
jgi:signal transduction histidine kinase